MDLKKGFINAPILICQDPEKHLLLEFYASDIGLGAVLSQIFSDDNKLQSCAFLSQAEQNYGVGDRDLLSWEIKDQLLEAQRFEPDPGTGTPNLVYVYASIRSRLIHWAHTAKSSCHP